MRLAHRIKYLVSAMVVAGLLACGGGDDAPVVLRVEANGTSTLDAAALSDVLVNYVLSPLSAAEADGLAFMREEEQLAHDVYAVSATLYAAQPIFSNITASEATHSAAIKALLDRYQQPDPLSGLPNGTFKTTAFQTLYDTLVLTSSGSLLAATQVGLEIEELDLRDITRLTADVDNADILLVYSHLLRGSRNHLRAFWTVLVQQGGTYVPKYLTQTEFDAIVNSPIETG